MGKDWKSCKSGKIGHSEVILSHFSGKGFRKVANWAKLAIPSHSEPIRWEKIGKVANWDKIGHSESILSHFSGKRLEKLQIGQNWPFRVILSHFSGKTLDWKSGHANWCKIGHSESF